MTVQGQARESRRSRPGRSSPHWAASRESKLDLLVGQLGVLKEAQPGTLRCGGGEGAQEGAGCGAELRKGGRLTSGCRCTHAAQSDGGRPVSWAGARPEKRPGEPRAGQQAATGHAPGSWARRLRLTPHPQVSACGLKLICKVEEGQRGAWGHRGSHGSVTGRPLSLPGLQLLVCKVRGWQSCGKIKRGLGGCAQRSGHLGAWGSWMLSLHLPQGRPFLPLGCREGAPSLGEAVSRLRLNPERLTDLGAYGQGRVTPGCG